MQQAANQKISQPGPVTSEGGANWNTGGGNWNLEGGGGESREGDDDGGWSSGPPAQGSGWTGASSSGSSHNLLNWQNSSAVGGDASASWQQKVPSSQSIIVDRNDKEAWPSIGGDHSESASETDNASVKSESVISGSSSFGQGQDNTSGSSAMQPPNSSSLWSSSSNFNSLESNTWDFGIASSAASSGGWSSSNPSLSGINQVPNMQGVTSIAGSSDSSIPLNSSSKLGWGADSPGVISQGQNSNIGGHRPQSMMQVPQSLASSIGNVRLMQASIPSSGAQPNGPQMSVSQPGPKADTVISGQSGSVFQGSSGAWGSVGSTVQRNDMINAGKGSSGNNQLQQSGSSEWGTANSSTKPSSSDGWPSGNPNNSDWGNPAPGAQWGTQITPSRTGASPQWPGSSTQASGQSESPPRSQTTWAQAAGKGLKTNPSSSSTDDNAIEELPVESDVITTAIESHDGWGQRPVRQDTHWDTETSPKPKRKIPEKIVNPPQQPTASSTVNPAVANTSNNMWNNNNGTAIWKSKEPQSAPPSQPQWNTPSEQVSWTGPPKVITKEGNGTQWGAVPPPKEAPQTSQWGGKTETGSWGPPEGASWREGQGPKRPSDVDDGTALWGTPSLQKQTSWTGSTAQNQPPTAVRVAQGPPSGWGENQPPPASNNPMWQQNMQQQNMQQQVQQGRPAGWGGDANQWNSAVGGPKPKPPPNSSWGEEWNPSERKDDMMWNEEGNTNWEDTDMGTWTDETQENNSTWSSAPGWKNGKSKNMIKPGLPKFPGGFQPPTQMRSLLLKQLMEMGFGKDEAQHALIHNNMNIQSALEELYKSKSSNSRRDLDVDVFHSDGAAKPKLPGMEGATDDISDTQSESNPYVPNINSMQNTPFPNAQSQVPNQFIANNMKGPASLNSSSQNINSSIMPPQQRLQEKFKQLNSMNPPPPGPPQVLGGRPMLTPAQQQMAQQQAQQQILQQLHLAVKAGLISPQLLNQQLPPPMLLLIQQLLHQQQLLQSLITSTQLIQQNSMNSNIMTQRQQLDQINLKISSAKHQILHYQRQIAEAQRLLIKPVPPTAANKQPPPQDVDTISSPDLQNLSISQSQPQQPQSKLSQWRKGSESSANSTTPTTPGATEPNIDTNAINKAVGSKPSLHQSSSSQNLKYGDLGLANLGGDPTWSNMPSVTSSGSSSWPSTMDSTSSSSTITNVSSKDINSLGKESQNVPNSSNAVPSLNDSIPEFVPGKPWQGISTKSVEEDPHITPGSFSRSLSLSVSTPKEDYLSSLTKTSPSVSESQSWNPKVSQNSIQKPWSSNDSYTPTSFSNEVWGVPLQKNRPPPGLNNANPGGSYSGGVNRQHSWAGPPSSTFSGNQSGNWDGRGVSNVSTCLLLKNLTPQVDGSTLRTLCMQHGPLKWFYLNLPNGQAVVRYTTKDEAYKAQKALNTCLLHNTTIMAEFISDHEASMYLQQSAMAVQPSQFPQPNNGFSVHQNNRDGWNGGVSNSSYPAGMWGGHSVGGLFSGDDHNANALLGNMLGETM